MALPASKGKAEFLLVRDPGSNLTHADFYPSNPRFSPTAHFSQHALHYGTSAFEGIRFYQTKKGLSIFRLDEHVDRLMKGMKLLDMHLPVTRAGIRELIIETVRKSGLKEGGYIRPLVGYGEGPLGVGAKTNKQFLYIMTSPWKQYLTPQEGRQGATVLISSTVRKTSLAEFKLGGGYVAGKVAHEEAEKAGADEGLLFSHSGVVSEGVGENLFVLKGNRLFTPRLGKDEILGGITRSSLFEFAQKHHGLNVSEKKIRLLDLLQADQLFFTGTAAEITPITHLKLRFVNGRLSPHDGKKFVIDSGEEEKVKLLLKKRGVATPRNGLVEVEIGGGQVNSTVKKLREHFTRIVRMADNRFKKWGTLVEEKERPANWSNWDYFMQLKLSGGFEKGLEILHPFSQFKGRWSPEAYLLRTSLKDSRKLLPNDWLRKMNENTRVRRQNQRRYGR
jgi:branched-chain amino acid aminotransferase